MHLSGISVWKYVSKNTPLFLATLVLVPCLAEEKLGNGATANNEQKEESDENIPEEFKDEVEQVKRGYPQLSRQSCLIFKRYGYCRHAVVKLFCVSVCTPCFDKLSRPSCRKVRYTYNACNKNIGHVYCRKTCGHCGGGGPLPKQCKSYSTINDITRRQSRRGNSKLCDDKIAVGWYRFVGLTGTYIPNRCVPSNSCGAHAAGGVVGNYPTVRGQTVRRQVCFNGYNNNCCKNGRKRIAHILITNCGNYYVFYLTRTSGCYERYCGNA